MKFFFTLGLFLLFHQLASAQMVIQMTGSNVTCFGGNNGTAKATASGGAEPYTYNWNNGELTNAIASLSAGTYTVTVTDNTGNTRTNSLVITQPPLVGATLNGQPQICTIAPDGFTYAIPTGGTPPYAYSWSNDIHTQLNNHLTANSYTVTVTDTRGCTVTGSFNVGLLGLGLYLLTDAKAATCPQPDNGLVSVAALSGNGPYQYQWNTGATEDTLFNLFAGEYQVTVSDVNGCSATSSVTVERKDVDPTTVQILIPQCSGEVYDFESSDGYHLYYWSLNDGRDSIVAGEGTKKIQVKWGAPGPKEVTVAMSDTITQCATGTLFQAIVYVCSVATQSPEQVQFSVGPNPFDQYIAIRNQGNIVSEEVARLYNIQGELVAEQAVSGPSTLLYTKNLPAGVYWLKMSGKSWKVVK